MKQNRHCQRTYFVLNAMDNYPPQSDHDRLQYMLIRNAQIFFQIVLDVIVARNSHML